MSTVARMMAQFRIHAIVVRTVEAEADEAIGVWGVVSDADLIRAAAPGDVEGCSAGGTARTPLVIVYPHEPAERAAELMDARRSPTRSSFRPARRSRSASISTLDVARAISAQPSRPA